MRWCEFIILIRHWYRNSSILRNCNRDRFRQYYIPFGSLNLRQCVDALLTSFSSVGASNYALSFNGLKNYAKMFSDKYFKNSLKLTVIFTIVTVFAEIVLGVAVALVLNQEFFGRGFVRGVMILPWALPSVVNAVMWKWIFHANYGALNALLTQLGLIDKYQLWLGKPWSAFWCVVVANIWKETPYVVLLTIAALSNISTDYYEAARVDGSNAWKSFWKITLPLIRPVVMILTITKTIWALQTFDLVHIMTGGGPASGTELMSVYIHKNTFKYLDFGYGAAMSFVLMLVCLVLTVIYIRVFMEKPDENERKAAERRRQYRRAAKKHATGNTISGGDRS